MMMAYHSRCWFTGACCKWMMIRVLEAATAIHWVVYKTTVSGKECNCKRRHRIVWWLSQFTWVRQVDIFLHSRLVSNECTVYFNFHMHDKSGQTEIDTQKNDHSWPLENISHDTIAVLCICAHTHTFTYSHTHFIHYGHNPSSSAAFPPSKKQFCWRVTAAAGYCVTLWVLVCEYEYGVAGFSPISFAALGVSGVFMASNFPEPKPLFLGIRLPHLSPLTYAISLSLAHIQTTERVGWLNRVCWGQTV